MQKMLLNNPQARENAPLHPASSHLIPLLVIAGPTASGKTSLAIALCEALNGEVVSADSMQVYRGMDIATAKPRPDETARVRHHLISFVAPGERFSVASYAPMAYAAIADIHARGKLPILCGGTGLYIRAVTEHWQFTPGEIEHDINGTWDELREIDPEAAAKIHPNDQKRISHAIALYHTTGVTLTEQNLRSREVPPPYRAKMMFLNARDRQVLYDRIDARVDFMLASGLVEEARLGTKGTAAQAIGHKELEPYLRGECTLDEAVERLKQETRRYAKRQLSWFRRMAREWGDDCVELFVEDEDIIDQAIAWL